MPKRPETVTPDVRVYPRDVAALFGITVQKFTGYIQSQKLPQPAPDGKYPLGEIARAYLHCRLREERELAEQERAKAVSAAHMDGMRGVFAGL